MVPSDRTIVDRALPRRDRRLAPVRPLPYGGRVHAAWGLALSARIREEYGLESDAIWSDDGIIVHLPDADEPPGAELVLLDPDELEDLVVGELGGSRAVRRALPRERRPRAADPARLPGPPHAAVAAAAEVADAARGRQALRRSSRSCSRPTASACATCSTCRACRSCCASCTRASSSVVEVETPTASPFASSLLFDYVATYMYEGDTPNAERRAAALALDRDLLRELLGQEELRDLIDPGALEQVEADLQRLSERTRADSVDALHDVLRRVGDLTRDEAARPRRARRRRGGAGSTQLRRRAPRGRAARRRRGALGRRRGRRACTATRSAPCRRAGCRRRSSTTCPTRWSGSCAARRAPTGRSRRRALRERYGLDLDAGAGRRSSAPASSCAASCARAAPSASGATRRCCGGCGAPRWPRCARRSSRPTSARSRASCRAGRASTAIPPAGAGDRPAARGARPAAGPRAAGRGVGARRAAAPHRRLLAAWLDQLCAAGEVVWVGAGALGRRRGRVALYFREDAPVLGPPRGPRRARGAGRAGARGDPRAPRRGACFFTDLLVDVARRPVRGARRRRCGTSCGPAR